MKLNRNRFFILAAFILALLFIVPALWQNFLASGAQSNYTPPTLVVIAHLPSLTPTPTATATTTITATPAATLPPTPGPSPTPSRTPTPSPVPTDTQTPTSTPTSLPQLNPVLSVTGTIVFSEGVPTPPTAVPSAVPTFEIPNDVTNILLLGSDSPIEDGGTRTDTIIIVSISHSRKTASILSIPRDLFVYVPGKIMGRINTALALGGVEALKQTILYNFGIPIHYYARIDFAGFKQAIDAVGGVDVAVSCKMTDWRLKADDLDLQNSDNWELYTIEPGVYHMDGSLALWYARSRNSPTRDDWGRGQRQQQILRALLNQGVSLNLFTQVPTLWATYQDTIDTDLDIGRMLQLAGLAPSIQENGIQNLFLYGKTQPWTLPESGANVQLPVWLGDNKMKETFQRLFLAPALNRTSGTSLTVEIINATQNPDLSLLAADNLANQGFIPVIGTPDPQEGATTTVRFYGPNLKGAYGWLISWVFDKTEDDIQLINNGDGSDYNYQVILGDDYDPCRYQLDAPRLFIGD